MAAKTAAASHPMPPRFDRSQLRTLSRIQARHPATHIQLARSEELGDRVVLSMPSPQSSVLAGRPLVSVLIPGSGRKVLECVGESENWRPIPSMSEALNRWVRARGLVGILCECEAERGDTVVTTTSTAAPLGAR